MCLPSADSVPEVSFIFHKMSVYSVAGTALSSAVPQRIRLPSHTLSRLLRNLNKDGLNKELITRVNIDVTSRVCLFE